jgi:acyl-CoA synthetase (AMP-forming)/AMP-acid ligase II
MRLTDQLLERKPNSRLWRSAGFEVNTGQLLRWASQRRNSLGESYSGRVALLTNDNLPALLALTLLDGLSKELLLIPGNIQKDEAFRLAYSAGINQIAAPCTGSISDGPSLQFDLETLLVADAQALEPAFGDQCDTKWIIPTSGTTGEPKLVAHTLDSLTRTCKTEKSNGAALCWGLLYDLSRFAGLQVFLQALCGGSALAVPTNPADISETLVEFARAECNALSATPSMWRKLLMNPELDRLSLKVVTLGGEIADQPILDALKRRFPDARVTHIYASTEAGVGFSVTDGKAGFPSSFIDKPPNGIQLAIRENGLLHIRPPKTSSYYIGMDSPLSDDEGWINSQDVVLCRNERIYFQGRVNGSINVGGNKVHPAEVESVILAVDGVAEALVTGKKNPILGELVEARVVPVPGVDSMALLDKIESACAASLIDYKRPAVIRFIEKIELTAAGKRKI